MLAIFDIDGTLCDTQEVEGRCYVEAIRRVTGVQLSSLDWTLFDEPTSSGIVREILSGDRDLLEKEMRIEREFVGLMKEERPQFPGDFSALIGAIDFVESLKRDGQWSVGIATGGFALEAEFKLECCGISIHDYAHATSSDTPKRLDIIPLCAERAGHGIDSVVYFGDAAWDAKVTGQLGIPMIGIGRRFDALKGLGAKESFRDYSKPEDITAAMARLLE